MLIEDPHLNQGYVALLILSLTLASESGSNNPEKGFDQACLLQLSRGRQGFPIGNFRVRTGTDWAWSLLTLLQVLTRG